MNMNLYKPEYAQYANDIFNDLIRVVQTTTNKVFSYESGDQFCVTDTCYEIYAANGDLIFKCGPGMTKVGPNYIYLPYELNKKLLTMCEERASSAPDVMKTKTKQILGYLQKFQGKSI